MTALAYTLILESNNHVAFLTAGVNIAVSIDNLFEGIGSVDDRRELSCFAELFEEDQVPGLGDRLSADQLFVHRQFIPPHSSLHSRRGDNMKYCSTVFEGPQTGREGGLPHGFEDDIGLSAGSREILFLIIDHPVCPEGPDKICLDFIPEG